MILGITSLGEGRTPMGTRLVLWLVHSAGGFVGGSTMAAILILMSAPLRTFVPYGARFGLFVVLVGLFVLVDLRLIRHRSRRGQVPATWTRRYGERRAYFLYGAHLGSGLLTYVPYAVTYGLFSSILLVLPIGLGFLAGGLFGLGRGLLVGLALLPATQLNLISVLFYRSRGAQMATPFISVVMLLSLLGTLIIISPAA